MYNVIFFSCQDIHKAKGKVAVSKTHEWAECPHPHTLYWWEILYMASHFKCSPPPKVDTDYLYWLIIITSLFLQDAELNACDV